MKGINRMNSRNPVSWAVAVLISGMVVSTAWANCGKCADKDAATKTNAACAECQPAKKVVQTTCPVTGQDIDKTLFVDHDGKRIYVCCTNCLEPVKKDPAKYIKQLEDAGVTVAKVQTTCPIMIGEAVDKKLYVDHDGKRVYVCCRSCLATVKKDPAKYIKAMEEEGIALDPADKSAGTTDFKK